MPARPDIINPKGLNEINMYAKYEEDEEEEKEELLLCNNSYMSIASQTWYIHISAW